MKNRISKLLCATALLGACALTSATAATARHPHGLGIGGADQNTEVFAGRSANLSVVPSVISNSAYFVASAAAIGTPRVTYLSVFTDAGTVTPLTFYTCTNSISVTNSGAANTNQFQVAASTGIATNDLIVYRGANDTYQLLVVSNVTSTLISTYQTLSNAITAGDILYEMTPNATIPIANAGGGSTTEKIATSGIFHGQLGMPLLITIGSSNATASIMASGEFYRRLRP